MRGSHRQVYWLGGIERRLAALGRLEAIEVAIGIILSVPGVSVVSGPLGLLLYIALKGVMGPCGQGDDPASCAVGKRGLIGFLDLEILDASFSLDGLVAAFTVTNDILPIMIGLRFGATVIRSMTVRRVRNGTLAEFIDLEHGELWGITALAILLLGRIGPKRSTPPVSFEMIESPLRSGSRREVE